MGMPTRPLPVDAGAVPDPQTLRARIAVARQEIAAAELKIKGLQVAISSRRILLSKLEAKAALTGVAVAPGRPVHACET